MKRVENGLRYMVKDADNGETLGFKVDSFWALSPSRFQKHPYDDGKDYRRDKEGSLIWSFLYMLNEVGHLAAREKLGIVAERFEGPHSKKGSERNVEGSKVLETLAEYKIRRGSNGRFVLVE